MKTTMCFEDLDAWKRARELVNGVYSLCREPGVAKDFGLRDQIQRAAVSVMSNIAEGFERKGVAEKIQFYNIARASCGEVRSLLYVIEDNFEGTRGRAERLRDLSGDVGRLASGLIASTQRRSIAKAGAVGLLLLPIFYLLTSNF
ncbi:MAG: four helix bundle protein [Verrucomicrobia bacterium]|nr:four helix bundle protein [Verrucomicrobiota bacterium]